MNAIPKIEPGGSYCKDTFLAKFYNVSRATIWRWAAEGRIPKPVKLSPGCSRWHFQSVVERLEGSAIKAAGGE